MSKRKTFYGLRCLSSNIVKFLEEEMDNKPRCWEVRLLTLSLVQHWLYLMRQSLMSSSLCNWWEIFFQSFQRTSREGGPDGILLVEMANDDPERLTTH